MPVELRKRKTPASDTGSAPPPKKMNSVSSAIAKAKAAVTPKGRKATSTNGAVAIKPTVGKALALEGFGGTVDTTDGKKTTLKQLVEASEGGVVLFVFPKASTPGCINQASLFRDADPPLTTTGLSIYGLSTDSPKANMSFKVKHKIPFTLLCDPNSSLIEALGFKKDPKGTTRGVFVIDKQAKVLAVEAGGPAATVEVVRKLVVSASEDVGNVAEGEKVEKEIEDDKHDPLTAEPEQGKAAGQKEDEKKAGVAADVADTAEKLDGDTAQAKASE